VDEGERVLARLLDALQRLARMGADDCSSAAAEIDVFAGYGSHPRVFTGTIQPHSGCIGRRIDCRLEHAGRVAHEGRLGSCLAEALTRPLFDAPEPPERYHVIASSQEGDARCLPRASPGTRSISCSTRGLRGERVALGPRPELLHDPARASCSGS
jgi:hypothetical protein